MPIVRLPGGDLRDEIRQPLYSTLTVTGTGVPAGERPVGTLTGTTPNAFDGAQFFSQAAGLARWQTNLRQASLLETAVSYRVQGMALDGQYIQSDTVIANAKSGFLPAVQDWSSVRVHIGEKDYWEGPVAYLMGRIIGNTGQAAYQHAGQPAVQGVILSGRHVVDINPLQSFYAQISVSVPATIAALSNVDLFATTDAVNLKFSFKGLQRRPVQ